MSKRGEDFARHGTNFLAPEPLPTLVAAPSTEAPLLLKKGLAPVLLTLPRFFKLDITDCIAYAKRLTKGRIPCKDKAPAIALILGAEGK